MKEIQLTQEKITIVDDDDFEWLSKFSCQAVRMKEFWYAQVNIPGKYRPVLMHRFILGLETCSLPIIDHINRDTLDNRRSNLRTANYTQNQGNRKKQAGSSQYKGVSQLSSGKWGAKVQAYGKQYWLGRFESEEAAAHAYDAKAVELFGEFARTNF